MAKETSKTQGCACPDGCKVVFPILMIVFGAIALVKQLNGNATREKEAQNA